MATKKNPKGKGPQKAAKASKKAVIGRPTKYQSAYAEQAKKLAILGMTDKRIADFFQVSEKTLNNWKHAHPDFIQSLKDGRDNADTCVANSLYHSALGGGTVTETREEHDAEGNVITKKTVKELPANVTAQIFWLKNRQPRQWRDKVVLEDETPQETLVERARSYEAILAEARERQRRVLIERGILPPDSGAWP